MDRDQRQRSALSARQAPRFTGRGTLQMSRGIKESLIAVVGVVCPYISYSPRSSLESFSRIDRRLSSTVGSSFSAASRTSSLT